MKYKENIEPIMKIICILLLITLLISFAFSMKYSDHKVYGMIFYTSVLILWVLMLIIPRMIFNVYQSIFLKDKKREIQKYEIWIYRIMAVCWMITAIIHIRIYMGL